MDTFNCKTPVMHFIVFYIYIYIYIYKSYVYCVCLAAPPPCICIIIDCCSAAVWFGVWLPVISSAGIASQCDIYGQNPHQRTYHQSVDCSSLPICLCWTTSVCTSGGYIYRQPVISLVWHSNESEGREKQLSVALSSLVWNDWGGNHWFLEKWPSPVCSALF